MTQSKELQGHELPTTLPPSPALLLPGPGVMEDGPLSNLHTSSLQQEVLRSSIGKTRRLAIIVLIVSSNMVQVSEPILSLSYCSLDAC